MFTVCYIATWRVACPVPAYYVNHDPSSENIDKHSYHGGINVTKWEFSISIYRPIYPFTIDFVNIFLVFMILCRLGIIGNKSTLLLLFSTFTFYFCDR